MTTVAVAEAFTRFHELLHRSHQGEQFVVVEGTVPLACLGPVPAHEPAKRATDFLAGARSLRARLKCDSTPITQDIAEGRL